MAERHQCAAHWPTCYTMNKLVLCLPAAFHKAIKAREAIAAMYRENIHRLADNIDRSAHLDIGPSYAGVCSVLWVMFRGSCSTLHGVHSMNCGLCIALH